MQLVLPFSVALIACLTLCLVVETYAHQWELLDFPSDRKLQKSPTPRAGGLAILLTCAPMLCVFAKLHWPFLCIGALIVYAGGLYDDRKPTNTALSKLTFQMAGVLFAICDLIWHYQLSWELSVVSFGFILCMINSFNLMDNMNGLTAGMSSVLIGALYYMHLITGQEAAVEIGALLGFLLLNYPWGRIYLGDQGSQLLGYWLSATAIYGLVAHEHAGSNHKLTLLASLFLGLAFLPFIFDTFLVIAIRLKNKQPISTGDQNHISHQLLRRGLHANAIAVLLIFFQFASVSAAITVVLWLRG